MVLRYMVSDTDLTRVELGQPAKEVEQSARRAVQPVSEVIQPQCRMTSSRKSMKLWFFLIAVVLGVVGYYLWTANWKTPDLEFWAANKVIVTGIIYHPENPSAIVSGRVVYEGDMIEGYKIVKIHKDKVQFEKKGKSFTKAVQHQANPAR